MGNLIFKWISKQTFPKMLIPAYLNFSYEYSFTSNRLWRKNRRKNLGLSSLLLSLCDGVDLNRNFGYKWHEATRFSRQSGTRQNCVETTLFKYFFSLELNRPIEVMIPTCL